MFYISWWYLLLVLVYPVIILLLYTLAYAFNYVIDLIDNILYKYNGKILKFNKDIIYNFCDKYLAKMLSDKVATYIMVIIFVGIPINNIVYYIRSEVKETNNRIEINRNYLKNKKYYYYRISGVNSKYNTDNSCIYYTFSEKSIDELMKEKYIKVYPNIYIKPFTITQITLEEFVEKYEYIISNK